MKSINVGLIGFGTVGTGVVKALLGKKKVLRERSGISINLAKIADKKLHKRKGISLPKNILTRDVDSILEDKSIDIVVELIGGIEPAKSIILKAVTSGKHVVTANKALLSEYGAEIFDVARKFRVCLGFEASVGGGIPIINALQKSLVSNDIELIFGVLNGTSNFILTKMAEENQTFKQALKTARERGIAEKDPSLDISGMDSCHKLSILALLGFGLGVKPADIYIEGIDKIDRADIQYAKKWGYGVKLLAIAKRMGEKLDLRVHPTLIPLRSVLSSVKDENNAIFIKGDMVGEALFYGKGAGSSPTASSVISDIIEIAKNVDEAGRDKHPFKFGFTGKVKKIRKINDLATGYYLRFSAIDKPGVLSVISKVLAQNKISIATVTQKERKQGQPVPIVMLTHEANEGKMHKALDKINRLSFIAEETVRIRIER